MVGLHRGDQPRAGSGGGGRSASAREEASSATAHDSDRIMAEPTLPRPTEARSRWGSRSRRTGPERTSCPLPVSIVAPALHPAALVLRHSGLTTIRQLLLRSSTRPPLVPTWPGVAYQGQRRVQREPAESQGALTRPPLLPRSRDRLGCGLHFTDHSIDLEMQRIRREIERRSEASEEEGIGPKQVAGFKSADCRLSCSCGLRKRRLSGPAAL